MAIEPGIWQARPHARHLGTDVGHFLRQLDYLMLAAVAGLVAYGLWIVQAVTQDDVAGNPTTSSSARASTSGSASSPWGS